MTDDPLFYFFLAVVTLAVTLWILYAIIRAATDSPEQTKLLEKQIEVNKIQSMLLAHLLILEGMSKNDVNYILRGEDIPQEEEEEEEPEPVP